MKKLQILFGISIFVLCFSFGTTNVMALHFITKGGDISSKTNIYMGAGVPAGAFFSEILIPVTGFNINEGDSGIILYTTSSVLGSGSQTNSAWGRQLTSNPVSKEIGKYTYSNFSSKTVYNPVPPLSVGAFPYVVDICLENTSYISGFWSFITQPDGLSLQLECTDNATTIFPVSKKIVLISDATVYIRDNIYVDPGGFFMVVSKKDIIIAASTTNLQGIYIAGGKIKTAQGVTNGATAAALNARGIFIAQNTLDPSTSAFTLWRTNTAAQPGEVFTYDPSLLLSMPEQLLETMADYTEIEP